MATQQTYYSIETTRSTTVSTTDVVFDSLTFTPDASSDYLLLWRATIDLTTTGSDVRANLYNGTSNLALCNIEPKDTTNRIPVGGIAWESFGSSPSSITYDVRYSAEAGTAGIQDCRIAAIKLGADDEYAESLAISSTTSTTAQVKATLTFTPPTTGDYYVFYSAEVRVSSTSYEMFVQVDLDSGTIYDNCKFRPKDSTNYRSWNGFKRVNLTNASHTFEIEYARSTLGTAYIRNARIVAIRADRFEADYYAHQLTEQSTTGTTYADVVTLTDTPAAVNHLVFASTQFGGGGTTLNAFNKLIEDSTDDVVVQEEPSFTTNRLSFFTFYEKTLAASSTTWKIQHKYEGAATVYTDEAAIGILQLETSVSGTEYTLTASGGSYAVTGTAAALEKNVKIGANAGSYTISGTAATLAKNLNITADGGSYSVSGQDAGLDLIKGITATGGSYTVAGTAVTFTKNLLISAEGGSYTVTGTAASLGAVRSISAESGSYTVSGTDATLTKNIRIAVDSGSYAVIGTDASFERGILLAAAGGSYTVTGQAVTFTRSKTLNAAGGSYSVSGTDAAFNKSLLIGAASGSYSVTGQTVTFTKTLNISAEGGSYSVSGTDASLFLAKTINAESGSYSVSGTDAALEKNITITAEGGSYTISGQAANFVSGKILSAESGSYTITGQAANLGAVLVISAEGGSYGVTGQDATLTLIEGEAEPEVELLGGGGYVFPYQKYKAKEYERLKLEEKRSELERVERELKDAEQAKQDKLAAEKKKRKKRDLELRLARVERDTIQEIEQLRAELALLKMLIDDEEAILVLMLASPF